MRLTHKFVLLNVGSILAPVLTVIVLAGLQVGGLPIGARPWDVFSLAHALGELESGGVEPARIIAVLQRASPAAEALVFGEDGRLAYSSAHGDSLPGFLTAGDTGVRRILQQTRITAADGRLYTVVAALPAQRIRTALHAFAGILVPGSLLGFMMVMSVVIIRSINTSIARLEEATRRISDGDLDFELVARGNDRLASLTRSFETMRQRVREETAARSRFIMAISHDLKTPLASITGYLDAITEGMAATPQAQEKYLAVIRDKAGLLESRISQLIDFVKLETSEWKRSRRDVPLAAFLDEAATVFATEAEARGFRFERTVRVGPEVRVSMDEDLFHRSLENLVDNAFRYANPGSAIRFEAMDEGGKVLLQISNAGPGIADKDIPFIFEPFYRGSRSRRETGFGLGLSVVKSVISSHGWDVAVRSQDGETRFTVAIPLESGSATPAPPGEMTSSRTSSAPAARTGRSRRLRSRPARPRP
jgi:signal transduction histidine kinase